MEEGACWLEVDTVALCGGCLGDRHAWMLATPEWQGRWKRALQAGRGCADKCSMTISGNPTSLLDSVLTAQSVQTEIGVTMLKKAQDQITQHGEAMVRLLEEIPSSSAVPLLDTFA